MTTWLVDTIHKYIRKFKFLLIRLLRIKDNAHHIAIGFTADLLINFVPSFGIGPIISIASAKLVRGNLTSGFIGGISIIWAFPLLFYLNMVVGEKLIPIELDELGESIEETVEVLKVGVRIGKAFFIGMCMNMLVFGLIIYFLTYTIIKRYRKSALTFLTKKWKVPKSS
ncbi:DUF2062 domain-containing protein [Alkalihalobacillus oceani]|uniref:DUF2062 domain-containing protein n=1 Tax=Halalkalibacter oceani TaxID=1653776 RepID=UPI0020403414|nr:DUF2062 domain-containing protein [Halalkalibacter oceani]MCM3760251.1 DUF2062 domain-containing protein [Halalkalibacter oceani]